MVSSLFITDQMYSFQVIETRLTWYENNCLGKRAYVLLVTYHTTLPIKMVKCIYTKNSALHITVRYAATIICHRHTNITV